MKVIELDALDVPQLKTGLMVSWLVQSTETGDVVLVLKLTVVNGAADPDDAKMS